MTRPLAFPRMRLSASAHTHSNVEATMSDGGKRSKPCAARTIHAWLREMKTLADSVEFIEGMEDQARALRRSMVLVCRTLNEPSINQATMTTHEVADLASVTHPTVLGWVRRGLLRASKVRGEWVFGEQDVLDFLYGASRGKMGRTT